ncbi:NlpC/P60 family protein [Paenibacillus chondroitinus]|uniref:NlpC/P60 family protein n=1 Tax=Paenibacillus chondroitinus TaxID=59842 RepID=A0ABU6DLB3_9BACL|nr:MULTISPECIES: NlpC/P60 family protein [Paenibacillus]MCY9662439.1 NlpC/P60 family protein [Paenibacillus anseongense]MEB4798568.1 NlpC/P60 family protein [Paenibacillus chondroitinus]
MKSFSSRLICSCALLCAAVPMFTAHSAQAASTPTDSPVKVQVNDELLKFPEVQPYIDDKGIMQVPLRVLSEKLGYQVSWEKQEDQIEVTLVNKQQSILLITEQKQALVNSKKISLESSPTVYQGNTYVPLRFITETFGSPIEWNEANQIAIVDVDGKSHKPAWIAPPPPPAPAPAPKVAAAAVVPSVSEQIIQAANSYMGVRYVWGGTTPSGFDCSGFVRFLYQAKGIDLPRTSAEMHSEAGTKVSDLKAGDLVFFASKTVNHVGIYLGNDQFISATTSRGVAVDSLSSAYWSARYVGARRVL